MSKIAKGFSEVAGLAAAILQFIPGGQPFAIAAAAIAVAGGAVASPPTSVPALDDYTVGPNQPYPYAMGRAALKGHMVHREAHGRTRQDVPNPWLTETYVLSGGGPHEQIQTLRANANVVTFNPANGGFENGYYDKYLRADYQTGQTPESTALNSFEDDSSPPTINYWGSTRKLSGFAAVQFSMLLDDTETHFRNGPPKFDVIGRWAKIYDPRLDSTYPGGTGSHRVDDESTYTYSANPILNALQYAYGRYQNGVQVCGGGLSIDSIDVDSFVEAANVCDTNGWTIGGVVYENGEDGEIWNNLKQIMQAGAAYPVNDRGVLRCIQDAPRISVDTITAGDLIGQCVVSGMMSKRRGYNTVIPKYISEANDWALVPSDAITISSLEAAQGEKRTRERNFEKVTSKNQAAALGVLDVYASVEIDFSLTVSRRFIGYNVGDAFTLDLVDELGLTGQAFCTSHDIDLATGNVTLTLRTITGGKYAFALTQVGTSPDHPALVTNEDLDLAANNTVTAPARTQAIATSYVGSMPAGITSTDEGSTASITIGSHTRVYGNPAIFPNKTVNAGTITGLSFSTTYYICYDDQHLDGGTVAYLAQTDPAMAFYSEAYPYRHFVGIKETLADGGSDTLSKPSAPGPTDSQDWDGTGVIP